MEIREAQRDCYCRGCCKKLSKGTTAFFHFSHANRGMNIIFCMDCLRTIDDMRTSCCMQMPLTNVEELHAKTIANKA